MSARDILAREAETVLLGGGFVEARADHFGPWWRVYGKLVNGDEHVGTTHLQADPQDPRDLARRLVAIATRRMPVVEAQPVAAPVMEEAHAQPVRSEPEPTAVADGGISADAGERQMGDGPAAADVPVGDAGSGTASDAAVDGGGMGDEPGESGLVRGAIEGEDFDMGVFSVEAPPTDAEFSEPAPELLEIEMEQTEPDLILIENDPNDIPVEEPIYAGPVEHGSPGGVVYFGDDIKVIQLAKMGRLAQIARALKDVLQEGWSIEEFRSLQNLIVRMDRGEAPNDIDAKYRFETIGERSRAMSRIDAYKDARELELDTLDRAGIEAFDPEWGWPE